MTIIVQQKMQQKFECKICNFITVNKFNFSKHILTPKHVNTTKYMQELANETEAGLAFSCNCGKSYPYRSSLYNHRKKCSFNLEKDQGNMNKQEKDQGNMNRQKKDQGNMNKKDQEKYEEKDQENKEEIKSLVIKLMMDNNEKMDMFIKENKELKEIIITQQHQIVDIIPKIGNTTNNTTNNKFNLNFFLNEQCKDALTMNQFIDRVHVSLQNLMTTNDAGLGPGLIKLINDNMNKLTIYERPIHCTDKKREIIYIKNEDTWEKDIDKAGIYNMIKRIEKKQTENLGLWTDAHPDYKTNSDVMDQYMHLIGKCTTSIDACRDKVIRNVCNDIFVKE